MLFTFEDDCSEVEAQVCDITPKLGGGSGGEEDLPIGFLTWLPMGCLSRWNCFLKLSDCCAALFWFGTVMSISLHLRLTAPPFSIHFPSFRKKKTKKEPRNDNGFYLMFFLLSHFPICWPIHQCHLCIRLTECSFTSASRVVLTTDDDVDRGDWLHECKFSYVAKTSRKRLYVCNVAGWSAFVKLQHHFLLNHQTLGSSL